MSDTPARRLAAGLASSGPIVAGERLGSVAAAVELRVSRSRVARPTLWMVADETRCAAPPVGRVTSQVSQKRKLKSANQRYHNESSGDGKSQTRTKSTWAETNDGYEDTYMYPPLVSVQVLLRSFCQWINLTEGFR